MASFTGVGDNTTLTVPAPGEAVAIALSGTYNMTILFQRQVAGGNAWETVNTYTTANATVADTYYTSHPNGEVLRLIVTVDTSGTATATLSDASDLTVQELVDDQGNVLVTYKQSGVTFSGDVTVSGSVGDVTLSGDLTLSASTIGPAPVVITGTDSITADEHAGRTMVLQNATGFAVTLPAATGTGNVYKFVVDTTVTSGTMSIDAAGSDKIAGMAVASGTTTGIFTDAGTCVSIDMNGSTTGGLKGTIVVLTDVASALWTVEMWSAASGTAATPLATS